MSTLFVVGLGIWLIGAGVAKLPNLSLTGAIFQIVGGVLVTLTALVSL